MTRTLLAVASLIAAAMAYASAAQACISCSYTPEVLNAGRSSSSTYQAKPSKRVREYSEQRERRAAKKRVTTREEEPKRSSKSTAAAEAPEKSAASTEKASTENSAITTTGAAIANHVKAAAALDGSGPQTENSTISSGQSANAASPGSIKPVTQATADKNVGCKKYFPSTGLTLSVPCE